MAVKKKASPPKKPEVSKLFENTAGLALKTTTDYLDKIALGPDIAKTHLGKFLEKFEKLSGNSVDPVMIAMLNIWKDVLYPFFWSTWDFAKGVVDVAKNVVVDTATLPYYMAKSTLTSGKQEDKKKPAPKPSVLTKPIPREPSVPKLPLQKTTPEDRFVPTNKIVKEKETDKPSPSLVSTTIDANQSRQGQVIAG